MFCSTTDLTLATAGSVSDGITACNAANAASTDTCYFFIYDKSTSKYIYDSV